MTDGDFKSGGELGDRDPRIVVGVFAEFPDLEGVDTLLLQRTRVTVPCLNVDSDSFRWAGIRSSTKVANISCNGKNSESFEVARQTTTESRRTWSICACVTSIPEDTCLEG